MAITREEIEQIAKTTADNVVEKLKGKCDCKKITPTLMDDLRSAIGIAVEEGWASEVYEGELKRQLEDIACDCGIIPNPEFTLGKPRYIYKES